ncbi:type I polyketide synthase [Frigidibacter sp.]|uniref:type I polyketide synthase n=1 Tax=Frigidibacter sp. TaxID=2586418 RepID=UPI0027323317|nr:type I polyketide synthase [Frigidibacter sp.]MDP3340275.1 beta-ketoacyl synthase N-terminal-like domain-containing protein [Frigidibacter sp.]
MTGPHRSPGGDIAIVGMACLFPGADAPARFWANICGGLEFLGEPLPNWGADRYLNGQGVTHLHTARGGYLGEAFAADPAELGVMPSSVDGGEPDQFLALKIARAALADAGAMGLDHTRTGIILGHSTYLHRGNAAVVQHGVVLDQTRALLAQLLPGADPAVLDRVRAEMAKQLPPFNADIAPGLVPNVMTGRIANRLDLRGPNYIIDAACSSSLLSVQAAMQELRAGRSDLMLAGGVNASISAEVYMVFNQLGALSRQAHVRPFAEGGDGTLLGEGLGVLALRRLEDAVADGQRVYAVLKGVGQSSDGKGSGLLAPRMEGEMLAIERALEDAGLPALAPGLIEAHGTGIPLGDRTEIAALKGVFGGRGANGLPVAAIGSVKSMIGHCIPAAGAAGLIKTALALYHRTLPPTIAEALRAELAFDQTPIYVNTAPRPWISAPGTKRRAAVNAFGFGGINAHAVLEEASAASPAHWPEELVLLSAGTPAALAVRARELAAAVARHPAAPLAALAASSAPGTGPARLALVAESPADLVDKLGKAVERLEAGRGSFRIRSGVFAEPAPQPGKMAFLFPGEGAQYQGMLSAVLMAFPAAREWFDFWDGLFPGRDLPPSASVFPPPTTLAPELAATLKDRLFGLELGSESVFIAAQALSAVLGRLGLQPDVVVGHSSGEHSALAAAGVLGASEDREEFALRIRALNDLYKGIAAAGGIAGGALLTVGAVPRAEVLALVGREADLHLALDNCQHQSVLYGPRDVMERVAGELRQMGGMCAFLPFDRPYHTPLFAPVAEQVLGVYRRMEFRAPRLPIWSCATAAPMPLDPGEIRTLAAKQWASRVRFTETVEALHDDGVRLFVEVGPSANLTGFVEDALKGRDALALATDSRRKQGLGQLLQTLGRIWVAGRDFDVAALYDGRVPAMDLTAAPRPSRDRVIDNHLPFLRLPDDVAAELAAALAPSGPVAPAVVPAEAALPVAASRPVFEPATLIGGHFDLMQRFLDTAGSVTEAALGGAAKPEGWHPPLLHRLLHNDGARLLAESDFDPEADPFLAHHVLYAAQVSDSDPSLMALPVLPLAVSLEMAAEAAAVLTGAMPARLENVRARDWIAFDAGPATLTTEAELVVDPSGGLRVAARLLRGTSLLFEAEVVAAEGAPLPALAPLAAPRPPRWRDDELYTTGMFHGPLFQGIRRLIAWDGGGLDAELADTPLDGFFGWGPSAPEGLLLNPVLLDLTGHVTAFWIAQGLGTDFSSFPSSIDRIDLPAAREEATAGAVLEGRIGFLDSEGRPGADPAKARFLQGEFTCTAPDGTVLMRASGWKDRFFRVPHSFYQARYRPREAWYGAEAQGLFAGQPAGVLVWQVPAFPPGFLEDAGGIWMRVLAATILSGAEREAFAAMTGPGKRRRDWIMGRIALKEAARAWILQQCRLALLPADIEIAVGAGGKPYLVAAGESALLPELSLAHAGGAAIAVAAPPGQAVGIDMEFPAGISADLLAEGAFAPAERAMLAAAQPGGAEDAARLLTGWCAKEAAAKAIGEGLTGRPRAFVLQALVAGATVGSFTAEVDTPMAGRLKVALARQGEAVLALALR